MHISLSAISNHRLIEIPRLVRLHIDAQRAIYLELKSSTISVITLNQQLQNARDWNHLHSRIFTLSPGPLRLIPFHALHFQLLQPSFQPFQLGLKPLALNLEIRGRFSDAKFLGVELDNLGGVGGAGMGGDGLGVLAGEGVEAAREFWVVLVGSG